MPIVPGMKKPLADCKSGLLYQEQIISFAAHNEPGNMEVINHPFMCAGEEYAAECN
jgi:hypothetical protein